jgi:hypothetical protein
MNERLSLYEIEDAKDFIERMILDDETELEEYSKALAIQEKNKVNAIVGYLREVELTAENAEVESKRLADIAKFYRNREERIKKSVAWAMQSHDIEKIETDMFRLSFRKSESVLVDDVEKLPEEFVVLKKSADKVKIKKALKDGETVEGATLVEAKNLQVK